MESAARSVRLSARGVRMSGRRPPFMMPMPTLERAIGARAPASILPCLTRSSIAAAGSMARSKASPAPLLKRGGDKCRYQVPLHLSTASSSWNCGLFSISSRLCSSMLRRDFADRNHPRGGANFSASLTPLEARTLISAAEMESRGEHGCDCGERVHGSPSDFHQVATDDDFPLVVLAHALRPHVVGEDRKSTRLNSSHRTI